MVASLSASDERPVFRPVPRTGVIFVMTEAARRGFHYGNSGWANLGQGHGAFGLSSCICAHVSVFTSSLCDFKLTLYTNSREFV